MLKKHYVKIEFEKSTFESEIFIDLGDITLKNKSLKLNTLLTTRKNRNNRFTHRFRHICCFTYGKFDHIANTCRHHIDPSF